MRRRRNRSDKGFDVGEGVVALVSGFDFDFSVFFKEGEGVIFAEDITRDILDGDKNVGDGGREER